MVKGTTRERSDVREMYLYSERGSSSSSSSFILWYDHKFDLFPLIAFTPFLRSFTYRILSYLSALRVCTPRSPYRGPTREHGPYIYGHPGPLNLTWQVPAEWTRLGPRNGPLPPPRFSLLTSFRCRVVSLPA